MDRLTAMVAIAHLRLRLEVLARRPQLLEEINMDIRKPIELAGLKSRLQRARQTEAAIAETGKGFDAVLDAIDDKHAAAKNHLGDLQQYTIASWAPSSRA